MANYNSNSSLPLSPAKIAWCLYFFCLVLSFIVPKGNFLSDLIGIVGTTALISAIILSIIEYVSNKKKRETIAKQNIERNLNMLQDSFNENIANVILSDLKDISSSSDGQFFYNSALELISIHNGNAKIKVFALNMGRWYYSLLRPEKKPTIYDEQAIQNDINARTS